MRRSSLGNQVATAVGAASVLLVAWLLVRGHGELGVDRKAFDLLALPDSASDREAAKTVVEVAKVLLAACVLGLIGWLAMQRAWSDCAAIVGGLVVAQMAAHIAKAQIARSRPTHALVWAGGYSFPSTTSAIGVVFLFLAVACSRAVSPRKRSRAIGAGALVMFLLGLSFVALRVHYLSDVIAGWALGVLAFVLCETLVGAARAR